jgi:catechol 2,3-dioxygenase-like lactoylglutathione lyase family enzyme
MLNGLNHITLGVSDLQKSIYFYQNILNMNLRAKWNRGAYFECGNLWLCLFLENKLTPAKPQEDYTHYAFSIEKENFESYISALKEAGVESWQDNQSQGESFYFLDPDNHKLEVHVGGLKERLEYLGEINNDVNNHMEIDE